jgi:hypothetical protein
VNFQVFLALLPTCNAACQSLTEGKSALSQLNRGLQHLPEAHRSPTIEQQVPGIDDTRDCGRKQSVVDRNFAVVVLFVPVDGGQLWSGATGVDGEHLPGLGIVDENEGVTAHSV